MMSLEPTCIRCKQPFNGGSHSGICEDCREARLRQVRAERRWRNPWLRFLASFSAVVVLALGCVAVLLIFLGWVWNGLEVIRKILGG